MSVSVVPQPDPEDGPRLYAAAEDGWSEPEWRLSNLRSTDGSEIVVGRFVCARGSHIKVSDIAAYVKPAATVAIGGVAIEIQYVPSGGPWSQFKLVAEPYGSPVTSWLANASEGVVTDDPKAYLSVVVSTVGANGAPGVTHQLLDPISRSELFQFAWVW